MDSHNTTMISIQSHPGDRTCSCTEKEGIRND